MENEEILLKNRTVAFLDILAFKQIFNKYPCANIGKAYLSAVASAKEITKSLTEKFSHKYIECEFYTFSDSIVILSPDDSKAGFLSVCLTVKHIVQHLITHQFPVRGAIAFGEVFLNQNPFIFLGEGYMKAYRLEKKHYTDSSIVGYSVPMKCGHKELYYTINWVSYMHRLIKENVVEMDCIKNYIEIIKENCSPSGADDLKKYTATLDYINYVNEIIKIDETWTERNFLENDKFTDLARELWGQSSDRL